MVINVHSIYLQDLKPSNIGVSADLEIKVN